MGCAIELENVVVGEIGREHVGGKDENAVDGWFAPIGDDDKRVVDDAVAVVADVDVDKFAVHLMGEDDVVVGKGQLVGGNGVGVVGAVRTGDEIDLPEGVATGGGPVGGEIVGVGIIEHMIAEGESPLAEADRESRVVVIVQEDGGTQGVGRDGETAVVVESEDAGDEETAGILIGVYLGLGELAVEMGEGTGGAVAEIPPHTVGRAFAQGTESDGVVHAHDAVGVERIGGDVVDIEETVAGLPLRGIEHETFGIGGGVEDGIEGSAGGGTDGMSALGVELAVAIEEGIAVRGAAYGLEGGVDAVMVHPDGRNIGRAGEDVQIGAVGAAVIVLVDIGNGAVVGNAAMPPFNRHDVENGGVTPGMETGIIVDKVVATHRIVFDKYGMRCRDIEGSLTYIHLEPINLIGVNQESSRVVDGAGGVGNDDNGAVLKGHNTHIIGIGILEIGEQEHGSGEGKGEGLLESIVA